MPDGCRGAVVRVHIGVDAQFDHLGVADGCLSVELLLTLHERAGLRAVLTMLLGHIALLIRATDGVAGNRVGGVKGLGRKDLGGGGSV